MSDENGDGIVVVMLIISTAFIVGAMFCFAFNIDISNETNIIETHYINDTFFYDENADVYCGYTYKYIVVLDTGEKLYSNYKLYSDVEYRMNILKGKYNRYRILLDTAEVKDGVLHNVASDVTIINVDGIYNNVERHVVVNREFNVYNKRYDYILTIETGEKLYSEYLLSIGVEYGMMIDIMYGYDCRVLFDFIDL